MPVGTTVLVRIAVRSPPTIAAPRSAPRFVEDYAHHTPEPAAGQSRLRKRSTNVWSNAYRRFCTYPNGASGEIRLKGHATWTRLSETVRNLSGKIRPSFRWQLIFVTVFLVVAHGRLLLENASSCAMWGNYALPCTRDQYLAWIHWNPPLTVWQPLAGMGSLFPLPFSTELARTTFYYPAFGLSELVGPAPAAAWLTILSTVFLATTFLLWTRTVVRDNWGRFAALILLIAGPFQLQLYGNGDYALFIAEAFVFLSIYLLYRAIYEPARRWSYFPASLVSLIVSFGQVQVFFLGLPLYAAFLVLYVVPWGEGTLRARLSKLSALALRFLTLPFLLAPLLVPVLTSPPFRIGPTSAYANPLLVFSHLSATPESVFFMLGYLWTPGTSLTNNSGYVMVLSASNSTVAILWTVTGIALVLLVWAGVLFFRDRRGTAFLALALLAAFFGSGTEGPLGPLNTYLYLHLPGYQEVNASYFWDWMVVVPVTALALGVLVERIRESPTSREPSAPDSEGSATTMHIRESRFFLRSGPTLRSSGLKLLTVGLVVIVGTTLVIPYAVGAQYGPVQSRTIGIQTVPYPKDYATIPGTLSHLVGSSYAGVAVLNPSRAWYLYNSTTVVPNYFYYYPTVREPVIPSYNTAPVASSYYAYWAYEELYSNSSAYVGQLLAVSGIGYLLVFYGSQPIPAYLFASYDGTNVSHLLQYQHGMVRSVSSKDFAIYKNLYFTSTAVSLSGASLVAGGYSELDAMAYGGLNLTEQGVWFASDLPRGGCDPYTAHASVVYTASVNSLEGLGLACTARASSDPTDFLMGDHTIYDGWASSFSSLGGALGQPIIDAWPSPLAVSSQGRHSTSLPIDVGSCVSCRLWILVRFASDGGGLQFVWEGHTWTISTNRSWSGENNSMIWVQLPFQPISGGGTLSIVSLSGLNAIGDVYVASPVAVADWLSNLTANKPIVLATPGHEMAPPVLSRVGQQWNYCGLETVDSLSRSSICFQTSPTAPIDFNLSLPDRNPGWLSLLVRASSNALIQIGPDYNQSVGFDTLNGNQSQFPMGWIRVPIGSGEISPNGTLPLRLASGALAVSEFVYAPQSAFPAFRLATAPPPVLNESYTSLSATTGALNVTLGNESAGVQELAGTLEFSSQQYHQWLGSVVMNRSSETSYDLSVTYSVSSGIIANLDGIELSGSGEVGSNQFTSSLFALRTGPGGPTSTLNLYSSSSTPVGSVNAAFVIRISYGTFPANSTLSNVDPSTSWNVTPTPTGYELSGGPASMVLVRVPFYPSLELTRSGSQLVPAFGSVDSLIVGTEDFSHFTVVTKAAGALELGLVIMGVTLAAWIAAEFLWYRYRPRKEQIHRERSDREKRELRGRWRPVIGRSGHR